MADAYAAAKITLRDNVKTLVTIFGGIAGVLLAGTPFTGYSNLDPGLAGHRWWIATVALVAAVTLAGIAILLLLRLLKPDLVYLDELLGNSESYSPDECKEVEALRKEFERRKKALLPGGTESLGDLQIKVSDAYVRWKRALFSTDKRRPQSDALAEVNALRQAYEEQFAALQAVLDWATFYRMRYRIAKGCNRVFVLGFMTLLAIGTFSWAIGPTTEDEKKVPTAQILLVQPTTVPSSPAELPELDPVLFEVGRAALSAEGLTQLAKARAYLRAHPGTAVLVLAYSGTSGKRVVDRALAIERAQAVRSTLMAEGDISASRVLVAELSESDLTALTWKAGDDQSNRSVRIMLLTLLSHRP